MENGRLRSKYEGKVRRFDDALSKLLIQGQVSFVALWQTEEYKNIAPLQKLRLCDTVTVYHRGLGIENSAKIVSVTYDVLLERYQAMTVGDVRTNLTDTMRAISAEINKDNPTVSAIKNAIDHLPLFVFNNNVEEAFIPEFGQHLQHVNTNLLRIIVQTGADDAEAVRCQYPPMQLVGLVLLVLLIFLIRYLLHGDLRSSRGYHLPIPFTGVV
ncbi:MAG: hypothetical protein Q4C10_12365 [Clostridia bacterium]|nr:hypothetical protein [Clostridia bacterium]